MADPAPERAGLGALVDRIKKLEREVRDLRTASGTQRAQAVSKLTRPDVGWAEASGFDLSAMLPVQFNLPVPSDMDFVNIFIVGHVEALDQTSGGLAAALAYIEVSGDELSWSRGPFSASKDAGASVVNNVISPITGFSQPVVPETSLLISMNVEATNPSAFPADPANFAIIQAFAIFSKS
ncbi:hypothetical protein ACIGCK_04745 [Microbacterium sp. NPDC078428]|uniref:hypothetical protein n=1 Tax=Microbacterium sp. NPDC078428 TaxID=3364190 RepID=UPI0037C7A805